MCNYKKGRNSTVLEVPANAGIVEQWLSDKPDLHKFIRWNVGGFSSYQMWSPKQKADLEHYFNLLIDGQGTNFPEVPEIINLEKDDTKKSAPIYLNEEVAWRHYVTHLAQSLFVEIQGLVNWSIRTYTDVQKINILDSDEFFSWFDVFGRRQITWVMEKHGKVTPGDPFRTYQFLVNSNLLKNTSKETIVSLVDWSVRLSHFGGWAREENEIKQQRKWDSWCIKFMEGHWQFTGWPPVERTISGTMRPGDTEPYHYTGGCWGTVGFYKAVLRTVNIPVKIEVRRSPNDGTHALPNFLRDSLFLSHGDDPYNNLFRPFTGLERLGPDISAKDLLIDKAKFIAWFGSNNLEDQGKNVGKGPFEASLEILPRELLKIHCRDNGVSHLQSNIFNFFKRYYTLQELENGQLWARIEEKLASLGGCDAVDP